MTKLTKPVVRETITLHRGRPLVVRLEPAGYIEVRPKGSRNGEIYRMTLGQVMLQAAWRAGENPRGPRRARERRIDTQ